MVPSKAVEVSDGLFCIILIDITYDRSLNCVWKKGMKTKKLLESFLPYYGRYKKILIFDLFCAALTTLGELILPLMLRYITNQGMQNLASMTAGIVIRIGGLYLLLRIIDSLAAYYMAYTGM